MTPSKVRIALDELLRRHPHLDVVSIDWQLESPGSRLNPGTSAFHVGPWVRVELGQPSDGFEAQPAWAVWRFAIWKRTGAVYGVDHDGAVIEPPLFVPSG